MSKLRVDGEVARSIELGAAELAALPGQVEDVAALVPGRSGRAVRLESLLEAAGARPGATHLVLVSDDGFAASVPLAAVRHGVVVHAGSPGGAALPRERGGPFRFLLPEAEGCSPDEASHCSNVKHLAAVRLSAGPGRDTRPANESEHRALHERERR